MTGFRVHSRGAQGLLRHHAGPHHARQGHRRRHAGRRLRRQARDHGADRAARSRVPGGHAVRQSGRGGRRPRDAAPIQATRILRARCRDARSRLHGRPGGSAEARRRSVLLRSRSAACSASTSPNAIPDSYETVMRMRQGALQSLLPRDARRRHLPRAVGLRSRLRLGGAHAGRHRGNDRCGRAARSPRSRADKPGGMDPVSIGIGQCSASRSRDEVRGRSLVRSTFGAALSAQWR